MIFLFPADVVRPRRVDEHFAEEAAAARGAGHVVALVDHDALAGGDAAAAVGRVPGEGAAVYRGWMLTSHGYAAFADALAKRDVTLRTSPHQYSRAHELPGWYEALAAFTPDSAWTTSTQRAAFDEVREKLGSGPAVVRDYSKSMKHYWDEAVYVPAVQDADAAWRVAARMVELRGDELAGGIVLRRYEELTGAEVRTWWVDGKCRLATAHPDTPDELPPVGFDAGVVRGAVAAMGLPFVTVDFSRRTDGVWRVVELGDGQVSDRPRSTPAGALIEVAG